MQQEEIIEEDMDDEEEELLDPQYGVQQEGMLELPGVGEPISYEQLEILIKNNMLTPE